MGAWIEISGAPAGTKFEMVAPYMGAWIEIVVKMAEEAIQACRSLHGSVD